MHVLRYRARVSGGGDRLRGVRPPPGAAGRGLTGRSVRVASLNAPLIAALACALAIAGCGQHPRRQPLPHLAHQLPGWLGLNYNSDPGLAPLDQFAVHGIVWDRDGHIEPIAGMRAGPQTKFGRALAISIDSGMTPDIDIDSASGPAGCSTNPTGEDVCLPVTTAGIERYVRGFLTTVRSVLRRYPTKHIVFEPTDEPWDWGWPPGTLSGRTSASEYARVLARLLPALAAARHPRIHLDDIYVAATGKLTDGSYWIPDLYAAEPCLAPAGPPCQAGAPHTPIEGWNVHPYGIPDSTTEGIGSVPGLRTEMRSGADNVIVSEIGFCANNTIGKADCFENRIDVDAVEEQTGALLAATLGEALPMHRAGWLRALIVWVRDYPFEPGGTGWAMTQPNGSLTPMGAALIRFGELTGHQ